MMFKIGASGVMPCVRRRALESAVDLVALRQTVALLYGETMLEGWAAYRVNAGDRLAGLLLLSSWRVMFVDVAGGFSAMPIANIKCVEIVSPTKVTVSTWYDKLSLAFDNESTPAVVLNLLRKDRNWNALELDHGAKSYDPPRAEDLAGGERPAPLAAILAEARERSTAC